MARRVAILRDIIGSSQQLQQTLLPKLPRSSLPGSHSFSTDCPHHSPALSLPLPPDITCRLIDAGAVESRALAMSKAFQRHVHELRHRTEARMAQTWSQLATLKSSSSGTLSSILCDKLLLTHRKLYEEQIDAWILESIRLVEKHVHRISQSSRDTLSKQKGRPFNYDYVPLLQHFFGENAFPSHADKSFLARKTGMTYHQIHVWFQNHRRRARKEGQPLRRKPMHEAPISSFDGLLKQMNDKVVPEEDRKPFSDSDVSEYEWQSDSSDVEDNVNVVLTGERSVLDMAKAPSHAFPATYPPPCHVDPFPVKRGFHQFPSISWPRKPAEHSIKYPCVDVEELMTSFSKMNVRDTPRKTLTKRKRSDFSMQSEGKRASTSERKPRHSAAAAAMTCRAPSAPLPALIPASSARSLSPSDSVSASTTHAQLSTSTQSLHRKPNHPPSAPPDPFYADDARLNYRKMAPLPKRMPKKVLKPCETNSSPLSPSSMSPSSSTSLPCSRVSSHSSETTQSSLFSSASSSSSRAITPATSPVSMPEDEQDVSLLCLPGSNSSLHPDIGGFFLEQSFWNKRRQLLPSCNTITGAAKALSTSWAFGCNLPATLVPT